MGSMSRSTSVSAIAIAAFATGSLCTLALVGWTSDSRAETKATAPPARVVPAKDACVRTAKSGKAKVTVFAEGTSAFFGRLEMDANGRVPEHRDATEEYLHVLAGSGTLFIEDKAHALAPGTSVFMPAGAKVRYENGPTPLSAIQVFAGPAPARKYDAWSATAKCR